jgi:hypothetical protein
LFVNFCFYLANNQSQTPPIQSVTTNHQSQSTTCLPTRSIFEDEEQRLLDAIHAHPNKRDLVLNLLRQMDQSSSSTHHHQQQQQFSDPSSTHISHSNHSNMEDNDEST